RAVHEAHDRPEHRCAGEAYHEKAGYRRLVARVERRNATRLSGDAPGERGLEVVESIDVDAKAGGGDYVVRPYLARVAPPVDAQAHAAVVRGRGGRYPRAERHGDAARHAFPQPPGSARPVRARYE